MVIYLQKVISAKTRKTIIFCVSKVTDDKSRFRIRIQNRIRIRWSEVRIRRFGSGSVPICHKSRTLVWGEKYNGWFLAELLSRVLNFLKQISSFYLQNPSSQSCPTLSFKTHLGLLLRFCSSWNCLNLQNVAVHYLGYATNRLYPVELTCCGIQDGVDLPKFLG